MADTTQDLNDRFATPNAPLKPEILTELQSILRLHDITPEELSWKWDAYCLKMGSEDTKLDLKTVRDFKKDLQEILEREARSKATKAAEKRTINATPRAAVNVGGSDLFDTLVANTPRPGTVKRKGAFDTPASKASKNNLRSSPGEAKTPGSTAPSKFADRQNAGQIQETLNDHISLPSASSGGRTEPRIKLKANAELSKFTYKTMAMKLSEASEILDERIDLFLDLVREHHKLEDDAFGNPSSRSPSEIVAVGRIASDSSEGKLNAASLVLETSRRAGAGLRVPLKLDNLQSYDFFPGKIVALRGTNATGDFFAVKEVLEMPLLPSPASSLQDIEIVNNRLASKPSKDDMDVDSPSTRPLNIIISSGPYTMDDVLDFSPLQTLLSTALDTEADAIVLSGPFIDTEHPLIRTGDFDLPANYPVDPDKATLIDVFRCYISAPINQLIKNLPSITVILVPSVRDAIAKHVAWPQDKMPKKELGLPKQCFVVLNPITLSLNELVFGASSLDVVEQLRSSELVGGAAKQENLFSRFMRHLITQRHFFPIYPPLDRRPLPPLEGEQASGEDPAYTIGAPLDLSYLKLGEWMNVHPDFLISPSVMPPFVKVVEGVVAVNPGTLMKKRGPGTFARLTVLPLVPDTDNAEEFIGHSCWKRCRVDIVRI